MALKPLDDRVVVEAVEAEEQTPSGIVIPDTAKEKPQEGKVIAVGPGRYGKSGKRLAMSVQPGQRVLFARYSGTEVKVEGTGYLVLSESDILAVVE